MTKYQNPVGKLPFTEHIHALQRLTNFHFGHYMSSPLAPMSGRHVNFANKIINILMGRLPEKNAVHVHSHQKINPFLLFPWLSSSRTNFTFVAPVGSPFLLPKAKAIFHWLN